ncbi:MAG: SseB family protein [Lachnospiraceae bacterium]|nr:SseB family protein [Lachnospiraceae bacterium]
MKNQNYNNSFLQGNDQIEQAIRRYYSNPSDETLAGVLETIRTRMHADGHFLFPVFTGTEAAEDLKGTEIAADTEAADSVADTEAADSAEDVKAAEAAESNSDEDFDTNYEFRTVTDRDGKTWQVAFTCDEEYRKGPESQILSYFMDAAMKFCLQYPDIEGFVINPWGESFQLRKEFIQMIFNADGDVEYSVPDEPVTAELLADGSYLKRVIGIYNRNNTQLNLFKLLRILRDSDIWIPCNVVMSERDEEEWSNTLMNKIENEGMDSLTGHLLTSQDPIRMIPDILQSGDKYFFPVFTSEEEMGEYGENFSKVGRSFPEAMNLARNNQMKVAGIVINAFTEPLVIGTELFDIIEGMDSAF